MRREKRKNTRSLSGMSQDRKYLWCLIFLICAACLLIFHSFLFGDETMVYGDIGSDTKQQYIMWYNTIANHIRAGDWSLWNFSEGLGANATIYNPTKPMLLLVYLGGALLGPEHIAGLMVYVMIAEILLSGIFCYLMLGAFVFPAQGDPGRREDASPCRTMQTGRTIPAQAKLLSSFAYAFNGYLMVWGQHYHLGSICVFLPLLILFSEKMVHQRRAWIGVSGITALVVFNGYYQAYMTVLGMSIYLLGRILIYEPGPFKKRIGLYLEEELAMALGTAMGAVSLLPGAATVMTSSRLSARTTPFQRLIQAMRAWDKEYNRTLIYRLFGNNLQGAGNDFVGSGNYYEAPSVFMSVLFIITLFQFIPAWIKEKRTFRQRIAIGAGILFVLFMVLIKAGSLIFNGFAYAFSRHTFLLMPFFALMMAWTLGKIFQEKKISEIALLLSAVVTAAVYIVAYRNYTNYLYETDALLLLLGAAVMEAALWLYWKGRKNTRTTLVTLTLALLICTVYDTSLCYNFRESVKKSDTGYFQETYEGDTSRAIEWIRSQDDQFYRIEKDYSNAAAYLEAMAQNYRGVSTYNSMQNADVLAFVKILWPTLMTGFDDNHMTFRHAVHDTVMASLTGVKYLLSRTDDLMDDGWSLIHQEGSVYVYRNNATENIAKYYTATLSQAEYESHEKQLDRYDLLCQVLITEEDGSFSIDSSGLEQYSLTELTNLVNLDEVTREQNVDAENTDSGQSLSVKGSVSLPLEWAQAAAADHVTASFTIAVDSAADIEIKASDSRTWQYHFKGKGQHAFYINIPSQTQTLTISAADEEDAFTLSQIRFYGSNTDRTFSENAEVSVFCNHDSLVTGTVTATEDGLLMLAIPYENGWKAYVDGQEQKIECVDYGLSAVEITAGEHDFQFRYTVPYLKEGILISCAAFLLWVLALCRQHGKIRARGINP